METTSEEQTADLLLVMGAIVPLPEPFQQRITQQLITEEFPKGHKLLSPVETCRRIYFIKKGLARSYHIDNEGRELTTWLMGTGDLMISIYSFFTQRPAQEYIEVLQDSILQSVTWNQLQSYYADFSQGNLIGRIVTEKYYIESEERALFLRTQSPEERYQALINKHPDIFQLTTITNIASYLCMTRETLSRLRSKLARNHR
jgi:CRP-like cAMP-binding protein